FEVLDYPGLPEPVRRTIAELQTIGPSEWTEISGIGRLEGMEAGRRSFILGKGDDHVRVIVLDPRYGGLNQFVDARLRVRGVPTPHFDETANLTETWFFISSLHDVQVETPALLYEATPILPVADLRDRPPASLP